MENIFAIYKPSGPSSNRILGRIRYIIKQNTGQKRPKVGHAGTLDPLAEGVLVVAIGREATKQLDKIVQKEKEYIIDLLKFVSPAYKTIFIPTDSNGEYGSKALWSDNSDNQEYWLALTMFFSKIRK